MDNDNGYTLCVLCCCSFNSTSVASSTASRTDLLNFFKILVDIPPQFPQDSGGGGGGDGGIVSDLQQILDNSGLSVCSDCHAFVTVALETRNRAEQMEISVRRLQLRILEQLRALQSEMDLFHEEMTKIESVVKTSDESCLLFHMPRGVGVGVEGGGRRGNGVMVLRERILDVVTDLRIYQVSCNADARLPVDESEVEAMWEDAQQLVQCTPDISMDYDDHDIFNDSSGGNGGDLLVGGTMEEDTNASTPTIYVGHQLGTKFYVEGESELESEDSLEGGGGGREGGAPLIYQPQAPPTPNKNFREDVIRRALQREGTRTAELDQSSDPLRRFYLRFNGKLGKLTVGSVEVLINEEDETLQCSQCSIMGKRSKSNHQSKQNWRDMEKGIVVHIIGKHLGGFTCQHCGEVFTSHTMIKKHVSKEHAGQTLTSDVLTPPPPVPLLPPPPPPVVSEKRRSDRPKPYACSMCPSAFSKPSLLKRHFLAKHASDPGQQLQIQLVSSNNLQAGSPSSIHTVKSSSSSPAPAKRKKGGGGGGGDGGGGGGGGIQIVSGGGGGNEKVIPTKSAQRPHECHVCKYAFTKGSHLKRHLEVHRKRNELV